MFVKKITFYTEIATQRIRFTYFFTLFTGKMEKTTINSTILIFTKYLVVIYKLRITLMI